jgi:large subunit ribosomal protein L21
MYAVVKVGGKQYRVEEGDSLLVDRLREDEGTKVALQPLLLSGNGDVVLDRGDLDKVKVEAVVTGHERGKKLHVLKFKPKKGYRRRQGHRSELTRIEIKEIKKLSRRPAKKAEAPAGEKKTPAAAKKKPTAAEKPKPAAAEKPKPAAARKKPAAKKKESGDGS